MRLAEVFEQIVCARGLHGVPEAPRVAEARHQAREDLVAKHGEPGDWLSVIGLDAMVDAEVIRTGPQRREAREAAARTRLLELADALLEAAAGLGWGRPEAEKAREIIATLLGIIVVRGAGGHGDLGGLGSASALPIVTCVRSRAGWGRAWVAAFGEATRALFDEWRPGADCERMDLLLDDCGDLVVSVLGEGYRVHHRLDLGLVHPEVWRLLADPDGPTVTGAPLPVTVVVPEYGAVELDGAPTNHPYHIAGAIELGREGRVSVSDDDGRLHEAESLLVEAQAKITELERLLDNERARLVTETGDRLDGTAPMVAVPSRRGNGT